MFEQVTADQPRDKGFADLMLRLGIALAFVLFGFDKFPSGPTAYRVRFFDQVGIGQWFRYFTGFVEVGAAVLVVIPKTTRVGIALLAVTMASAALIVFHLGRTADSAFPGFFFVVLTVIWWARGRRSE
jgi:putative oxidoreductase